MTHITTTRHTLTTTFDFAKMANSSNNYDANLVHPQNHHLAFISKNGEKVSLTVGQIAVIVAICNEHNQNAPGKFIDYCFKLLTDEQISKICKEF